MQIVVILSKFEFKMLIKKIILIHIHSLLLFINLFIFFNWYDKNLLVTLNLSFKHFDQTKNVLS